MSKRRQAGDWVWLLPMTGFRAGSHRLRAQIQPEDWPNAEPMPCMYCDDPDCREWVELLTEPDPVTGMRHGLCHASECKMLEGAVPKQQGADMTEVQSLIWQDILAERQRQDQKHGASSHSIATWLLILGEEVGEVSKAALGFVDHGKDFEDVREELIHVAAVSIAILEDFRNGWRR